MAFSFLSRKPKNEPEAAASFDTAHAGSQVSIAEGMQRAAASSGAPPMQLMREYSRLAFGPGKVSFEDYVKYRLFDDAWLAGADKADFVGSRRNRDLSVEINYRHDWHGLLTNKVVSQSYLATYGLPTIAPLAIYAPGMETPGDRLLRSREALRAFLLDARHYPIFGKPVESYQSLGALALLDCDAASGELIAVGDKRLKVDETLDDIEKHYAAGYLFQKMVKPHRDLIPVIGERLATVRLLTIATPEGPKAFRAGWKLPAAGNVADNFWRAGNMLAGLDFETGRVLRVTSGMGFDMKDVTRHPDTGAELIGLQVPDWGKMKAVAVEGAKALRHFGMIGWDMAPTDDGPVIVEANETPDFALVQVADRRGILCKEFNELLSRQQEAAAARSKWAREALGRI
ncbi:MAG TPA: sugar-transfer associated ATP-grasp domain-containing protein [Methylocystis sp.]